MDKSVDSLAEGRKIIKRYSDEMPGSAGVYRMVDAGGQVLYVGKAKHLKNRVSSYLNVAALNTRLQRMIAQTASMEIVTTRSEAEALLLEANLIKKFAPRYNILLKDDKSFPYILLSGDHEFSRISKHRGAKTQKGKYFGPFVSAGAVDETITLLQKAFLLRSCSDNIFKNRTRPCMLYQIKRCSAPCVGKIQKKDYDALVDQAKAFLSGNSRGMQDKLVAEMQGLSLQMHYEKARIIRDRIRALAQVQQQQNAAIGDADIIALARDQNACCIQLFSYRGGRNYGNRTWFPANAAQESDAEIIRNFIGQYYQSHPVPALILTSHLLEEAALLEEALKLNHDYKIEIVHPLRGEKREVVNEALRNAQEALARHLSIHATQAAVLEGVQKLFGLEELPQRIEVYDNSHISGTHAVGAMIVAGTEGFIKSEYRKFNMTSSDVILAGWPKGQKSGDLVPHSENPTPPLKAGGAGGDDYAMLREVLTRRFKKLQEIDGDAIMPSLVLIDGGAGQISTASAVLADLGIQNIVYIGIAKGPDRNAGREQFFIPGKEPFQLPENDPVLHYLQRLRDEAHRFAIGAHRNKRSAAISKSELDEIPFIGPGRKKALLHHFGSARAVSAAGIDELQKVEGISKSTAKVIYEHFHGE